MKKLAFLSVLLSSCLSLIAQETYVPDDNLEQHLINQGYDSGPLDNYIPAGVAETITTLTIVGNNVNNFTGIEEMVNLETFAFFSSAVTNLDLSQNTALKTIFLNNAPITSLDLSKNILLEDIYIDATLATLDISSNTALKVLDVRNNSLTDIDVSKNTALTSFNCSGNSITHLDLSKNTLLTKIVCENNQLSRLDVKNGNNNTVANSDFKAGGNPNLSCINVDDSDWSATNWENIEATTTFDEYCHQTYVPDDNFEAFLEANAMGNGIANDDYVSTEAISTLTTLTATNKNIVDLTGIEDFSALQTLEVFNNKLETLDVSANTHLETLRCYSNNITSLTIGNNPNLKELRCYENNLSSMVVSDLTGLEILSCSDNQITSIDVSNSPNLTTLFCQSGILETLTISNNPNLRLANVSDNNLTEIDASSCSSMTALFANKNNLTSVSVKNGNNSLVTSFNVTENPNLLCIEVDDNEGTYLQNTNAWRKEGAANYTEDCTNVAISGANFELFLEANSMGNGIDNDGMVTLGNINAVSDLDVSNQNITDLAGLVHFEALETLICNGNPLTTLDLSNNTNLISLEASSNANLTTINTTDLIALQTLTITNNPELTIIDASTNINLTSINVTNNALEELKLNNGNTTQITNANMQASGNNFSCINVDTDAISFATSNWENIDNGVSFSDDCYNVYIPDNNFEHYLETHNASNKPVALGDPTSMGNGILYDNYIKTNRITDVTELKISNLNIADLTGLEFFTSLKVFTCNNNIIESLDVTKNTALIKLHCERNDIKTLDISTNVHLESLHIYENDLTTLDVSSNIKLEDLQAFVNDLTTIDLQTNTALKQVFLGANELTSLNLNSCIALESLIVNNNNLSELSLINGNNLNINTFNVLKNPNLKCINVDDPTQSYLNTWEDIDPEVVFGSHCYETYIPDNAFENYLETHDALGNIVVLGNPESMGNGIANDDYVLTDRISSVSALTIDGLNIEDLTGIEDFVALVDLDCSSNLLDSFDLSSNTNLQVLDCSNNTITTLDLSAYTLLTHLNCSENNITTLDVSSLPNLEDLNSATNNLTTIDLSNNTLLTKLDLSATAILNLEVSTNTALQNLAFTNTPGGYDLDLSVNTALVEILLTDSNLTGLNLKNGNNANITNFNATGNQFYCIEVENVADAITNWGSNIDTSTDFKVNCSESSIPNTAFEHYLETHDALGNIVSVGDDTSMGNGIDNDTLVYTTAINTVTDLDISNLAIDDLTGISHFTALESLNCSQNTISTLDLFSNTNLRTLIASSNINLSTVNIKDLSQLETLTLTDNAQLTQLDLSTNTGIVSLDLSNNGFTTLDLTQNINLTTLDVSNNALTTLYLNNGNNAAMNSTDAVIATGNPDLACIRVDDDTQDYFENWKKDLTTEYGTHCYETFIPDTVFENFLETHDASGNEVTIGHETSMGNGIANDQYVLTNRIATVSTLRIRSLAIANLTGIEDFMGLKILVCNNNNITRLDVSKNIALTHLECHFNQLTTLNLSANTNLIALRAYNNNLTSLDLSFNTALKEIHLNNNPRLTSLNVANGNNLNFTVFNTQTTENLSCITVDDPTQPELSEWQTDDANSFSINCLDTMVPDANFENYLETHDAAGNTVVVGDISSMGNGIANDGYVTKANIESVLNLDISNLGIADLTGIEHFIALESLRCDTNTISTLDVSNNTNLTILTASDNTNLETVTTSGLIALETLTITNNPLLTSIDVSTNTGLISLDANGNGLTLVDVSQNTSLATLDLSSNQLSTIDITNNTEITTLDLSDNELSVLDITKNTGIITLSLTDNELSALDISQHTDLTTADISNNQLTTLEVTNNTQLESLKVSSNNLTTLSLIQNTQLTTLDVSNNLLTILDLRNNNNSLLNNPAAVITSTNPNLSCIHVDNATATYLSDWTVDVTTSFGEHCHETNVPDDHFEHYLETHDANGNTVDLGDPTSMGNGIADDDHVTTNRIANIISLDVNALNITDLTGIEDFIALETLICNSNALTTLDISTNTALLQLNCIGNQLTALDIDANVHLEELKASQNALATINLQENIALKAVYLQGAGLSTLNLNTCVALEILDVSFNSLSSLSIVNGNNAAISSFNAAANPPLACIDVDNAAADYLTEWNIDDATASFGEHCYETYIPDDNFEHYLETHDANRNEVEIGDPTSMGNGIANDDYVLTDRISEVTFLSAGRLEITDLTGIENFTALETLYCFGNNLTTLDVSSNTALKLLICYQNALTSLDLSANINLEVIEAGDNELTTLDVRSNTALKQIHLYQNNLTNLNVDTCVNLEKLLVSGNDLRALRIVNGNNAAITDFDTSLNPNLSCINVDDPTLSDLNDWLINEDGSTSFGLHCNETHVPDLSFEHYLETHDADRNTVEIGDPTSMGNGVANDQYVSTLSIQSVINLRIANLGITDLTGIEGFTALESLNCGRNTLTNLDVSANTLLKNLSFDDNQITAIDVTNHAALTSLSFNDNQISTIDITNNTLLTSLSISENPISSIDLSQNVVLDYFTARKCLLTSLDFSNNPLLEEIDCSENLLTNLNINQCTVLEEINCEDNKLQHLDLSNNTEIRSLNASMNSFTDLETSANLNIERLELADNELQSLDISQNFNIEELILTNNALTRLNVKNGNNTNIALLWIDDNPDLTCVLVDDATYSFRFTKKDFHTSYNEVTCDIQVSPKVFLQGAALHPNTGEEDLMRDDLRVASLLPTTSPYSDGIRCNASVFETTGENAVVDWVWVELRDSTNNALVIDAQSALLQRDGNVVTTDGINALNFNQSAADYHIVIKHRNHLGIMTSDVVALSIAATIVDFTDANTPITYGTNAQTTLEMQSDIIAMWTGNVNQDTNIQYSGTNSDAPSITSSVLNAPLNFLKFPTYTFKGYHLSDTDMDGNTQATGTNSDTPYVLQNILVHPGNPLKFNTYKITEQLPENQ